MTPRRVILLLALLLAAPVFTDAQARERAPLARSGDYLIRVAERPVSMRDAINRVRKQTGGRVLDAQDRGKHYRIKVLTPDGEVRVYRVDAQSGAIR